MPNEPLIPSQRIEVQESGEMSAKDAEQYLRDHSEGNAPLATWFVRDPVATSRSWALVDATFPRTSNLTVEER